MTDATGKKIEFILILLALMVLVLLSKKLEKYASGEIVKLTEKEKKSQVIVLDAGHGGSDPGKIGVHEEKEKEINLEIALKVEKMLKKKKITVSTAESCTGGSIAARLTSIAGSSEYFNGSIVAYSNEVKMNLLYVSPETLERHGAVSEETVIEMVKGAMKALKTDCAVATSGIAGPGGGTPEKPVGTVWIAAGYKNEIRTYKQETNRGRSMNIERAGNNALLILRDLLK